MSVSSFDFAVVTLLRLTQELEAATQGQMGPDPYKDIYIRTVVDSQGKDSLSVQKESGNIFKRFFQWCNRAWNREYYLLVKEDPYLHSIQPTMTAVKLASLHKVILEYGADEGHLKNAVRDLRQSHPALIGAATDDEMVKKVEEASVKLNTFLERINNHKKKKEPSKLQAIDSFFQKLFIPTWSSSPGPVSEEIQNTRHDLMHSAITFQDLKEVERLLGLVDINRPTFHGDTFAHEALRQNKDILGKLLDAGADPTLVNYRNESVLDIASSGGVDTIRTLLQHGVSPAAKTRDGIYWVEKIVNNEWYERLVPFLECDKALYKDKNVSMGMVGAEVPLLDYLFASALARGWHECAHIMVKNNFVDLTSKSKHLAYSLSIKSRSYEAQPEEQSFIHRLLSSDKTRKNFLLLVDELVKTLPEQEKKSFLEKLIPPIEALADLLLREKTLPILVSRDSRAHDRTFS